MMRVTIHERDLQASILSYLRKLNIFAFKVITANIRGVPDLVIIYKSVVLFVEVKTPKGRLADLQKIQMVKILRSKGYTTVVRSVEDVHNLLLLIDSTSPDELWKILYNSVKHECLNGVSDDVLHEALDFYGFTELDTSDTVTSLPELPTNFEPYY